MPSKPPKACACPGCPACAGRCPNTAPRGRCTVCQTEANRQWRNPTHAKVYNSKAWQGLRTQVLREQPWCAEPGCSALSVDVHHIVELSDDPSLAYTRTNVEGRCHAHHSRETALSKFHRG